VSTSLERSTVEALYRKYGFQVESRCRRILGDADEAADAAQEVFVTLMTKGGGFRGDATWMTWLYRVATNVCLNRLRDSGARRQLLDINAECVKPRPATDPGAFQYRDALRALLGAVDRKTQEIAVYYFLDEMSQTDIGKLMGMSRVSVNKRLAKLRARAQKKLRRLEAV